MHDFQLLIHKKDKVFFKKIINKSDKILCSSIRCNLHTTINIKIYYSKSLIAQVLPFVKRAS